jgi:hypothetical protein
MAINIRNTVDGLIQKFLRLADLGLPEIAKSRLERKSRELRRQRRHTQLAEHLSTIQTAAAVQKANDFDPNFLYNHNGLPE